MENSIRIENNRIFIMDLLRNLLKHESEEILDKISPTRFAEEMKLNVEQRLKQLKERSKVQKIGKMNRVYTIPDLVLFQNFETHTKYSTQITLMHQKQFPVRIKVHPDLSPCFTLHELPGTIYSKLAPGTSHKMSLDFYSEESRDYLSSIAFDADGEVFVLPIVALAPRPVLIFPDLIELPETVVNIQSERRVFMKNSGKCPVVFKIESKAPFSTCPKTGIIEPNGVMDVEVSYKINKVERNVSELMISFEGVNLFTTLICQSKNCEIYLDRTIVKFEDTYMNLERTILMNIVNNSYHTMKFQWKLLENKFKEIEKCKEYRLKLKDINEYEMLRNIQKENPNVDDVELHEIFLRRIYEDEIEEFNSTDQFLFNHPNFKIITLSGSIGPQCKSNVEIIFCPTEHEDFTATAYLEVTGRETRQPLRLFGTGLGPEVVLNVKTLTVEQIFLCAKHQYELVAKNVGIIPATLKYVHKEMDFGGTMSCFPSEVYLPPGKCEKLVMEFFSNVQGKFFESLSFIILESSEHIGFVFEGNVVTPILLFDVAELNFGTVAFGFTVEKEITIENTMEVPIEFRLDVLNDGYSEAITWVNFSMTHDLNSISELPKEFKIFPENARIPGNSSITAKITFIPNKVRRNSTFLQTFMWGLKKPTVEIPIFYECIVPTIETTPSRIDIRYCFINSPYERVITIKNVSNVPGYIHYQKNMDDGLSCELSLTDCFIEPGEEIINHLKIVGLKLGQRTKYLSFTIFGQVPTTFCKLSCDVQGPVVCVNPSDEVKFGSVKLLQTHSQKLAVMNDSPVPATVKITVDNPTFTITPNEFVLESSETMEVDITIYLTYVAKYVGNIYVNVENVSDPIHVSVNVHGVGSCVLFQPILEPSYDLGTLMTYNYFKVPFKMTNLGRTLQRIYFSPTEGLTSTKKEKAGVRGYPINVEPYHLEINVKETMESFIDIYSIQSGYFEKIYYCYWIGDNLRLNRIFSVKFHAIFEDPTLTLLKTSLDFRMDVHEHYCESHLIEKFPIKNDSYLPFEIYVSVKEPFYVVDEKEQRVSAYEVNIKSDTEVELTIEFVPPDTQKRCALSSDDMKIGFKFHPKTFSVRLTGIVNYPTIVFHPESIENQLIFAMSSCSRQVIMENISPLPAEFEFFWDASMTMIEKLPVNKNKGSSCVLVLEKYQDHDGIGDKREIVAILDGMFNNNFELCSLKYIFDFFLKNARYPYVDSKTRRAMFRYLIHLLSPILRISQKHEYLRIFDNISKLDDSNNDMRLNITPFKGVLRPYECNLVNFHMRPPPHTNVRVTAKCRITAGAEEQFVFSGICGNPIYELEKTEINLGKRIFLDVAESNFMMKNVGAVEFEYVIVDDTNSSRPKPATNSGWLTVTPNLGGIEPGGQQKFLMKYKPGSIGKFSEIFNIEIGYLSPISIRVIGYGVYSQVYIFLPRRSLTEAAGVYLSYNAIADLTDLKTASYNSVKSNVSKKKSELDEVTVSLLKMDHWEVVEHDDPDLKSSVDIDMAIERFIGHDILQNNRQHTTGTQKKSTTVPNFVLPPYTLAFGKLRADRVFEKYIVLFNYGPTNSVLKISYENKKSCELKGFSAELVSRKLKFDEATQLYVRINPNPARFDEKNAFFNETIFIEVNRFVIIPIEVSACIGLPKVELKNKCLDYNGVIVGYCKRKTICLHNNGFVEVKWACTIDVPMFFIREYEGSLDPGDILELHIYFEPRIKGAVKGVLTINIDADMKIFNVQLNGYGLEPRFIIKDPRLNFAPMLQFSHEVKKTFLLQNASSFPNEISFFDLDEQTHVDEAITDSYFNWKNAKKVYVAKSRCGNKPSDVYRFFKNEMSREIFTRKSREAEKTNVSEVNIFAELERMASTGSQRRGQNVFIDPLSEVEKNNARALLTKIIVFHGNKFTDYLRAATEASKKLSMKRYSLDNLIIHELAKNISSSAQEANEIIDEAYVARHTPDACLCKENAIEDGVEGVVRKMEWISNNHPVSKKSSGEKGGSYRSSKKQQSPTETFCGISEETLTQILTDRIENLDSMILESLDSKFFASSRTALKCFLKAIKDISCVYFVFFQCTYKEHVVLESEHLAKEREADKERKSRIRFKLANVHDFSSLDLEERNILVELLNERRLEVERRRKNIRTLVQYDLDQKSDQDKMNDLRELWAHTDKKRNSPQESKRTSRVQRSIRATSASTLNYIDNDNISSPSKEEKSTPTYFSHFNVKFCEIIHLLSHWDRKKLEMAEPLPNFNSGMMANPNKRESKASASKTTLRKGAKVSVSAELQPTTTVKQDEKSKDNAELSDMCIGYPVWIVGEAHRKRPVDSIPTILNLLQRTISTFCLTSIPKTCSNEEITYYVIRRTVHKKLKEKPDVFNIFSIANMKDETIENLIERNIIPPISNASGTFSMSGKKKKRKKKHPGTGASEPSVEVDQVPGVPGPLHPPKKEEATSQVFSLRFLMEPEQTQIITLAFNPLYRGHFKYSFNFEVVASNFRGKVDVVGSCDYPRIDLDPNVMFSHTVERLDSKTMFLNGVYVISHKTLDFGSVLLIPNHLIRMKSTISMLNVSMKLAQVIVSFMGTSNGVFYVNDGHYGLLIKPDQQFCLDVYAKPSKEGLFRDSIQLTIRNNPSVHKVNLSCYACLLKFEMAPRAISFNKVMLGKTETEKVLLKNSTAVMVYFELEFDISPEFRISSFNGYINACTDYELVIAFSPRRLGFHEEFIKLKVFDKEKQYHLPVFEDTLTITAETVTFGLEYNKSVNLGVVKGKTAKLFYLNIKNTGKHDVKVILTRPNETSEFSRKFNEYFKIKYMEYIVNGCSTHTNTFKFICDKDIEFSEVPIVNVAVLDNYRNSLIDTFKFTVSGKVSLSKFELCPFGDYFFGFQNVNTKHSNILTLKNTGQFEFKYKILTNQMIEEQQLRKSSKRGIRGSARSSASVFSSNDVEFSPSPLSMIEPKKRGKSKQVSEIIVEQHVKSYRPLPPEELTIGVFTIKPSFGTVQPGETMVIDIITAPEESIEYKEQVVFFVSESAVAHRRGCPLNLQVNGTEPKIGLNDHNFMYPEVLIVENISDVPYATGEYQVFEISTNTLHFGLIPINKTVDTRFRIPNTGHVTATVHFEVYGKGNHFHLSQKTMDIAPCKYTFNTVTFAPTSVGIWTGTLTARCQGFSSKHLILHEINLKGEACMPMVEIIKPKDQIEFDPICIDHINRKEVVFKNTSRVPAKLIVDISEDPQKVLSIMNESNEKSIIFNLKPGEEKRALIDFSPREPIKLMAYLNAFIDNNCFDSIKMPIYAQCVPADVCLEDLPARLMKKDELNYNLDFGSMHKNEAKKKVFKIRNTSDFYYRFEFKKLPNGLTIIPMVGHLYPGTTKTITAGFHAEHHCHYSARKIDLNLNKILLDVIPKDAISWDDRQTCTISLLHNNSWVNDQFSDNEVEVFEQGSLVFPEPSKEVFHPEPSYMVIEASSISFSLSACCDYGKYKCAVTEINFSSVPLYTEAVKSFMVKNSGSVDLNVEWELLWKQTRLTTESTQEMEDSISDQITNMIYSSAFSIEPARFTIPPEKKNEFFVKFTPRKHLSYSIHAKANMKILADSSKDLKILLNGDTDNFPYNFQSTHMENSSEKDLVYGSEFDENSKVLNFLSLGIGTECNRTLSITNDSDELISFIWKRGKINAEKAPSFFYCEFERGSISAGKFCQTNFVFIPQCLGEFTEMFTFIPTGISLPTKFFLMKGICREPRVYFERPFLTFNTAILNHPSERSILLINDENQNIQFKFKKDTLMGENQHNLTVTPMSGFIKANSGTEIKFASKNSKLGETIFSPLCEVQFLSKFLRISVITNTIVMKSSLKYFDRELLRMVESKTEGKNILDLGVIVSHKREEIKFLLHNLSDIGMYYSWFFEDQELETRIQFMQPKGYLRGFEEIEQLVLLTPVRKCVIKNVLLKLKILFGPTYVFRVTASADKPKYEFSFLQYNFGNCLIQQAPEKFNHTQLIFKNNHNRSTILEKDEAGVPEFSIEFKSAEVKSNQTFNIDIFFCPTEEKSYEEAVIFLIDSKKQIVKLKGVGVPLSLDVLSLKDKFIDFGTIRVGKIVQKTVKILNSSDATIEAYFDIFPRLPFHKRKPQKEMDQFEFTVEGSKNSNEDRKRRRSIEKFAKLSSREDSRVSRTGSTYKLKNKVSSKASMGRINETSETEILREKEEMEQFVMDSLEIYPKQFIKLHPGKTIDAIVKFKPNYCFNEFKTDIYYEVQNYKEPILTVIGSAIDASFNLNKDVINFGNIVIGYSGEETVALINDGHVGANYKWYLERNSSYISFVGGEGYSPPNSTVTTGIIFKPGHVQCVFRFKAFCQIENYKKRLELRLTGGAMNLPPPLETIRFVAPVRDADVQEIPIQNDTKEEWNIKPIFTGSAFSGPDFLKVPKESVVPFEITFAPMKMSSTSLKGTVFFPLSSGFSRLYALDGTVLHPKPLDEICKIIQSKTYNTEYFPLENWMAVRQQFKVTTEVIEGDYNRIIYKVISNEYVEIPPFGKRDYKWTIYVLNEGKLSLKVTFLNESTHEYMFYTIAMKIVTTEDNIENIKLITYVREPVVKKILVKNPLNEIVTYNATSSNPFLVFEKTFTLRPYEKYELSVKYLPIKEESFNASLQIFNSTVGTYNYNLILQAYPPKAEPEVQFKAYFGQRDTQTINLSKNLRNHEIKAKFTGNSKMFEIVKIQTQTEKPYIEVLFDPCELGTINETLQFTSSFGDYKFSLVGESIYPEPQGPLKFGLLETVNIDFRNPYKAVKTFNYQVDSKSFKVKPQSDELKPKKSTKIAISFVDDLGKKLSSKEASLAQDLSGKSGKLTISCDNDDTLPKWIYYLQCKLNK